MAYQQSMAPELRRGLIASVLFHLGLLVLFLLATIEVESIPMHFAEVAFISGTPGGRDATMSQAGQAAPAAGDETVRTPAPRPAARQQENHPVRTATEINRVAVRPTNAEPPRSTPVTPPKRRMLEEEEPLLARQEQGKITPGLSATPTAASQTGGGASDVQSGKVEPSRTAGTRSGSGGTSAGEGQQGGTGSGQGSGANQGGGSGQPFTIEGDAAQRLIIKQVIPRYPEGLQQEAVIQFKFTVQPDGRLTGLIPMRKGDPTLEKITLAALRQWLFSPLPAHAEQKPVQGIITFRYQLE
jgi:hypothetical protein